MLVGLTGDAYDRPTVFDAGFDRAMIICAVLFTVGGVLSLLTIRAPLAQRGGNELAEQTAPATAGSRLHCGVGAPPLTRHSPREG